MSEIFEQLPGLEVPVQQINQALARMWVDSAAEGRAAPQADAVKATQVNFILHVGFGSDPADALEQFRTTVDFSSRYPSRVVVLCPRHDEPGGAAEMRAKIYGECFLGKTKGDSRCCEFVVLSYTMAARQFLESQVSICLLTDLPVYYWLHRFRSCARLADYQYLLRRSSRLIVDMAVAPADTLAYPWPNPGNLRDLAYTRILPVRQSVGQFLSRYEVRTLIEGLTKVVVSFEAVHTAEGRALKRWVLERLYSCGAKVGTLVCEEDTLAHKQGVCLGMRFIYEGNRHFAWHGDCHTGVARFSADLGNGLTEMPSHISLLDPTQALTEALFF